MSGTVKDLVVGSGIGFEERGERELKGVPGVAAVGGRGLTGRPRPLANATGPRHHEGGGGRSHLGSALALLSGGQLRDRDRRGHRDGHRGRAPRRRCRGPPSTPWEVAYAQIAAARAAAHGAVPVDPPVGYGSAADWIAEQCRQYNQGRLHPSKAARLESIPGWNWSDPAVDTAASDSGDDAGAESLSTVAAVTEGSFDGEGPARAATVRSAGEYRIVFADPPPRRRASMDGYVAPDSHRAHGTYVKYVQERCHCEPCKAANRDYERRRQAAIRNPDQVWAPYVPAGPARRHAQQLAAAGLGLKQLARVSGVSHGTLTKLIYGDQVRGAGPSKRIRQSTADRILAVTAADRAGGSRVAAESTWQLIEELVAAGYTKCWIAAQLGRRNSNLTRRGPQVTAATARLVGELHRDHINLPPPARVRRPARSTVGSGAR